MELLETGVWIAATTSLALGNNEIDQAVRSAIVDMIAVAKVAPVRMTPKPPGSSSPAGLIGAFLRRKSVNYLTLAGVYLAARGRAVLR
jgi:hypothetical protein